MITMVYILLAGIGLGALWVRQGNVALRSTIAAKMEILVWLGTFGLLCGLLLANQLGYGHVSKWLGLAGVAFAMAAVGASLKRPIPRGNTKDHHQDATAL